MTPPQRLALVAGLILVGAMVLFPPWSFVYNHPAEPGPYGEPALRLERPAGYHLLVSDHVPNDPTALANLFGFPVNEPSLIYFSLRIDVQRLVMQLLAAVVLTGALVLLFKPGARREVGETIR